MYDPHNHTVVVDAETRARADLKKQGRGGYFACPDYEPLLISALIRGEMITWERPYHTQAPQALVDFLSEDATLVASHGDFDFYVFDDLARRGILPPVSDYRWRDTMAVCRYHNRPPSLKNAAIALGLDTQKMDEGKKLIALFSSPDKKSGAFADPSDHPDEWHLFRQYCEADVRVCRAILGRLGNLPHHEQILWRVTRRMNARGVPVDAEAAALISARDEELTSIANNRVLEITQGIKPGSIKLKDWLNERTGGSLESLGASSEAFVDFQARTDLPADVAEVLRLRSTATAKATKKAAAVVEREHNGRVFDQFIYCGASQTQRFSGRDVQPQNFARTSFSDLEAADLWEKLKRGDRIDPDTSTEMARLGGLMRSVIRHPKGIVWADLAGVEFRNAALLGDNIVRHLGGKLTGTADLVTAVKEGADFYSLFAIEIAAVLNATLPESERVTVTVENAKKTGWRGVAKVVLLAAQYAAGTEALRRALKNGTGREFTVAQVEMISSAYRETFPQFPAIWGFLEEAFIRTIGTKKPSHVPGFGVFEWEGDDLTFLRPSGSRMRYPNARLARIRVRGIERTRYVFDAPEASGKMVLKDRLHKGTLTEHVVSSFSRDMIAHAMIAADRAGLELILTVHDELVVVGGEDEREELHRIMLDLPSWARPDVHGVESTAALWWGK